MKVKTFILMIVLLLGCSYVRAKEKKTIPEELSPILKEAGREDPFALPEEESKIKLFKIQDLQLQGILWDEKKPLAIINAEIVSEGQEIRGKKIIKIEKDSVIVETSYGERHTIQLHKKGGVK